MDKIKVLEGTKTLKSFFISQNINVRETKEALFRMIDYIDTHYDEDKLDVPFNGNGNGKDYKPGKPMKGIKLEINR